jgi:hypothetical protein
MPSSTRTLVSIAPLCNTDLTVTFTKHDVKAYNQASATILEGWCDPGGANDWHFPIVDSDHNSNEDSSPLMTNSPSFLPPTLLQNLYPRQLHQSLTPTGTASSMRSGQPKWYS